MNLSKSCGCTHTHTHTHVYSLDEEKNDGITLIALIITIIVLLILAGVAVSLLLGDNGVITRAQNASDETKTASVIEDVELAWSGRMSAYYDAYANDSNISKNDYFGESDMNKELSGGKIVADSYKYNENNSEKITFTYEMNSTGEKYGVEITEQGKVSITSYNGVEIIKGDENFTFPQIISKNGDLYYFESKESAGEKITSDNLGKYLGKAVKYVPSNSTTNTSYGTGSTYRLFYIDFTGKYEDGEEKGTIYLKADCDDKYISLNSLPTNNSSSDNYAVMQKLNPSWVKPDSFQNNDTYVSRILDPANWTGWKDTTTEGIGEDNINYVVGSPSLEIYVDSYNAYLDSHSGLYMNESTTTPAKKLICEYVMSGYLGDNSKGYIIGFASDSWPNNGYWQNSNSLISSLEANGMYNPGSEKFFWLASPSAYYYGYAMYVYGGFSRVSFSSSGAFCPLVSLKSGVTLELVNDNKNTQK